LECTVTEFRFDDFFTRTLVGKATVFEFTYQDRDGKPLFIERREERPGREKVARPCHLDGTLGFPPHVTARPLYRWPELLASSGPIFVVEGPKKAEKLRGWGLVATCNVGGAGQWVNVHKPCLDVFKGRDVVILPDNDTQGWAWATDIHQSVGAIAASFKIVELPRLAEGEGGDILDWDGTTEELEALVASEQSLEPPAPSSQDSPAPLPHDDEEADPTPNVLLVEDVLRDMRCEPSINNQGQGTAKCPAHNDSSPSFRFRAMKKKPLKVWCLAGCQFSNIMTAMGLSTRLTYNLIAPEDVASLRKEARELRERGERPLPPRTSPSPPADVELGAPSQDSSAPVAVVEEAVPVAPKPLSEFGSSALGQKFETLLHRPLVRPLVEGEARKLDWLCQDLIPCGGSAMWVAKPRDGKTTLVRELLRVMTNGGGELLGRKVKGGRALIITEEPAEIWYERADKYGINLNNLLVSTKPFGGRPHSDTWKRFCGLVAEAVKEFRIDLLIVDVFFALTPRRDDSSNDGSQEAIDALAPVTGAGASFLLLHHVKVGKENGVVTGDPIADARGGYAAIGSIDVPLGLKLHDPVVGPCDLLTRPRGDFCPMLSLTYDLDEAGRPRIKESAGGSPTKTGKQVLADLGLGEKDEAAYTLLRRLMSGEWGVGPWSLNDLRKVLWTGVDTTEDKRADKGRTEKAIKALTSRGFLVPSKDGHLWALTTDTYTLAILNSIIP
jgi:hypothetical protein